jgi:hypothetical protein
MIHDLYSIYDYTISLTTGGNYLHFAMAWLTLVTRVGV